MTQNLSLPQAPRRSLVDTAIELIRTHVESGAWKRGEKIPKEAELADMLQVSRNTVREAVRVLSHAKILDVRQGDGTYVGAGDGHTEMMRRFDRASLREHLELRAMLETEAARLAAARRTPEDIARLSALLTARGERPAAGDIAAFVARDIAFHLAIAQAARNTALEELYRYFLAKAEARTHVVLVEQGLPEPDEAAHGRILAAIARGNPEEAAAAARDVVLPVVEKLTAMMGP